MRRWLYALACVLVPVLWGVLVVWVSNRLEGRLFRPRPHDPATGQPPSPPPVEYHI
jgi:hypothetical protein